MSRAQIGLREWVNKVLLCRWLQSLEIFSGFLRDSLKNRHFFQHYWNCLKYSCYFRSGEVSFFLSLCCFERKEVDFLRLFFVWSQYVRLLDKLCFALWPLLKKPAIDHGKTHPLRVDLCYCLFLFLTSPCETKEIKDVCLQAAEQAENQIQKPKILISYWNTPTVSKYYGPFLGVNFKGEQWITFWSSSHSPTHLRQTYPVLPDPRYSFVSVPQWPHPLKYPHVIPGLPLFNWAFQSNIDLHQHVLPCFTNPWQSKCLNPLKKKWMVSIYVKILTICLRLIISLLDFPRMFSCRVQRSFLAVWRPGRR